MEIRTRKRGEALVVAVQGRLGAGENLQPLHATAESVSTAGNTVVLDLEHVELIDCTGIGQLIRLRCALERRGATLTLINLSPRHKRLLDLVSPVLIRAAVA